MQDATTTTGAHPPLSPEALAALGKRAWPLLPVLPQDRRHLLRDEAALLIDELLVKVARGSGAIAVAMGECLDALCTGDGPMRLGYANLGDYVREELSLAPRTAKEWAKLARDLRTRPLLRAVVRSGEVSIKKALAMVDVAVGDSEAEWVERAKRDTVRGLRAAARGDAAVVDDPQEEQRWHRIVIDLEPEDREVVDRALDVAGKVLRANTPKWQRVEAIAQEYLGSHRDPRPAAEVAGSGTGASGSGQDIYALLGIGRSKPSPELREWLEREYDRWSYLHSADPVPAPEAEVDDNDRAHRIHERLLELASMRRGWDELVGHLSMLLINTGLWRDMKFLDVDHYASERLGMSGRAIEQRAWLERRLWDFPALRRAMREGRLGYEQARLVARCSSPAFIDAWIAKAEKMKVVELARAVEADEEAQMCARKEWAVRLPADVHQVFKAACRAVRAAAQEWIGASTCLVIMCQHFIDTYEAETRRPNTPAARAMERDRGLCTCPGCSKAADHVHHIKYRSRGGCSEEWNLTSLCAAHHLHGVHKGHVRVGGAAPAGLRWELGEVM
ncbi:MAG TPA: HNH endonuclease signature motif containing protein [Anaeromyxobacter sp.]|nr:HNH endonuclease signature motif containing protein [Anaeromyxobacter sp.]